MWHFFFLWSALAVIPEDEVTALPGWNAPLFSRLYSGFLDCTPPGEKPNSMLMHYLFVQSEGNPSKDPLLVWSNGGPGAPSEFGMFTELGPYFLSDASLQTADYNATGIPTLFRNEHAWSKVANVLIYDSPPPVGFSYCGKPGGDGYSCGDWNDTRTTLATHKFLENWLSSYPEFASHDLYLSGESYAGVYIPALARAILNDNSSKTKDHLKGFAVGDACVGLDVLCGPNRGQWFQLQFFHGHGQISDKLYENILETCGIYALKYGVDDPRCQKLLDAAWTSVGGYYAYGLYDECGAANLFSPPQQYWSHVPLRGALNDYPCGGGGALVAWANNSIVQSALHCPKGSRFFITDDGVGFNYTLTEHNLMPFYQQAVKTLRVLVYNGDTDPGINSFVAQNWTSALGFPEREAWRPWTIDGKQQMGGYVTRYATNFDFLTIRGSGHMVPEFKPQAALAMITAYLNNEEYKPYVPPPP